MVSRQRMIIAAVGTVVVGALLVLTAHPWGDIETPAQQDAAAQGAGAGEQTQALIYADEVTPPTPLQNDQIVQFVGDARRLARDGRFDAAEASLQKAEKISKTAPQIGPARDEIARLTTPEGRLAAALTRARLAVEHGDKAAADRSLAEIEKIKSDLPELAELRAALQQQQARVERRDQRIQEHLKVMRESMTRGDFAAADSELNAASRIDVTNPAVRRARDELAEAYEESRKKQARQ